LLEKSFFPTLEVENISVKKHEKRQHASHVRELEFCSCREIAFGSWVRGGEQRAGGRFRYLRYEYCYHANSNEKIEISIISFTAESLILVLEKVSYKSRVFFAAPSPTRIK
jgi:hypothetical protein